MSAKEPDMALDESLAAIVELNATITKMAEESANDLNNVWTLIGAFIVFIMQCGFAMLESGTVQKKNTISILYKNLLDSCVAALVWWAIGYPVAFGKGNDNLKSVIGGSNFFMAYDKSSTDPGFYSHWVFQWAFAATSATIVSGAVAERCRYTAYVIYTIVITGFIYPVVVHWVWSDWGWLSAYSDDRTFGDCLGLLDFAGSSVVHVTGGLAALVAAFFLAPRYGRFDTAGQPVDLPYNSESLMMLGSLLLWFGWYAFNSASGNCVRDCTVSASLAAVNTTLGATSAAMTALVTDSLAGCLGWFRIPERVIRISAGLNGLLSGLVGITAGCALVEPYAACIIGALSGLFYWLGSQLLLRLQIDDPLDASAVHFGPGFLGTVLVGLFATETNTERAYENFVRGKTDYGAFYGGGGRQLGIQLLGAVVITAFSLFVNVLLFCFLNCQMWLRVPKDEEEKGLDDARHGQKPKEPMNAPPQLQMADQGAGNSGHTSNKRFSNQMRSQQHSLEYFR